jgi:adenosylcobinamide-phosphate synthase
VWRAVRVDAPQHPSPNAGVAEAAFAGALGLRLGGENRYGDRVELRASLGDGRAPEPADIERAVRLARDVSLALAAVLGAAALLPRRRRP